MPPDLRYLVEIDEGLHRFSLEIMVSKLMSGREAMIGIEPIIQKEPCRIGDIFVATVSPCVYLFADSWHARRSRYARVEQSELIGTVFALARHIISL